MIEKRMSKLESERIKQVEKEWNLQKMQEDKLIKYAYVDNKLLQTTKATKSHQRYTQTHTHIGASLMQQPTTVNTQTPSAVTFLVREAGLFLHGAREHDSIHTHTHYHPLII